MQCLRARSQGCGRIPDDESAIRLSPPYMFKGDVEGVQWPSRYPLNWKKKGLSMRIRMIFLKWQFGGYILNFKGEPLISANHQKSIHF